MWCSNIDCIHRWLGNTIIHVDSFINRRATFCRSNISTPSIFYIIDIVSKENNMRESCSIHTVSAKWFWVYFKPPTSFYRNNHSFHHMPLRNELLSPKQSPNIHSNSLPIVLELQKQSDHNFRKHYKQNCEVQG